MYTVVYTISIEVIIINQSLLWGYMKPLNANKIMNLIVSKMYYNTMGNIQNNLGIKEITFSEDSALIVLEDGRYFRIIIETSK